MAIHRKPQPVLIRLTDTSYAIPVSMDSRLPRPDQMRVGRELWVELPEAVWVQIPKGFITDCHSVPLVLNGIMPEYDNRTNIAAIVHDYLYMYFEQFAAQNPHLPCLVSDYQSRRYADSMYLYLMNRFGAGNWRNRIYYRAVRWFGGGFWTGYRRMRQDNI